MQRRKFLNCFTTGIIASSLPLPSIVIKQKQVLAVNKLSVGKDKNGNYYNFSFPFAAAEQRQITVWYYKPVALKCDSPIVFVMPGIEQNGVDYLNDWVNDAKQYNFLLLVPQFFADGTAASSQQRAMVYNQGNVFDNQGQRVSSAQWSFTAVENLFDYVRQHVENTSQHYYIYGHSAGGQFVHRLVLFLPEARYSRAVAANPGWYTMPIRSQNRNDGEDFDQYYTYPYGLANSGLTAGQLQRSLSRDFLLLLGDRDTNKPTNDGVKAAAQGANIKSG